MATKNAQKIGSVLGGVVIVMMIVCCCRHSSSSSSHRVPNPACLQPASRAPDRML